MRSLLPRMFEWPAYLACALVLAGLSVGTTWGQSSANGAKVGSMAHEGSPLEGTLKTDRDSYKLGDEISVQVDCAQPRVTNGSSTMDITPYCSRLPLLERD
jgi:hypothetical protein